MNQVLTSVTFTMFVLHVHHFVLLLAAAVWWQIRETSEEMAVLVIYDNGITPIKKTNIHTIIDNSTTIQIHILHRPVQNL